jgi:hypothetical protein
MTAPIWLRRTGRTLNNNSTSILSAAAVGGVIVTTVLAVRAGRKTEVVLESDPSELPAIVYRPGHSVEKTKAMIRLFWRDYIPPTVSGLATIACIVGANQLGLRKQAAMLGAYTIADGAFREYKREVGELLGEKKDQAIHDRVAVKKMEENPPPPDHEVIIMGGGEQLCYDTLSGRYFKSDIETIRRVANDINEEMLNGNMWAALNQFWNQIGLDGTTLGDEMGFNLDHTIQLTFTSHLAKDGRTALAVTHTSLPVYDYGKVF